MTFFLHVRTKSNELQYHKAFLLLCLYYSSYFVLHEFLTHCFSLIFSEEFGINVMSNISDDYTFNVSHYGPQYLGLEDSGTTHLNVLAPDGQAVAVTS